MSCHFRDSWRQSDLRDNNSELKISNEDQRQQLLKSNFKFIFIYEKDDMSNDSWLRIYIIWVELQEM